MLIAQVFPVISVYNLRGGQYAYRGNVVSFPQDVQEFVTRLPRNPSSLDALIVRHHSTNGSAFRDFCVRRKKITQALHWLKINNIFYRNIDIDENILQSLPENGSIANQLPQLTGDETEKESSIERNIDLNEVDNEESEDYFISQTFVPSLLPGRSEDDAINKTLDRMQQNRSSHKDPWIDWPHIESFPINEFHTAGYMVRAFPTLFPRGTADFRSHRVKDVKPAEYFKHLLIYKDGRFARHPRWRYFALNSIMRWRALSEGRLFVRQNLEEERLTIAEVLDLMKNDNNMVNRVIRYGEGLHGTRQYWMRRRAELKDMIKQLGHQGMIFFTFSAADLHWPDLHQLMPGGENHIEEADKNASKRRHKDLINNPHIAAWYFEKRFKIFFEKVMIPKWNLVDWWYRFEWQHRGSVHVHGIAKLGDAPKIEWEKMSNNQEIMEEVVHYLDSLVTTINPDLNAFPPNLHLKILMIIYKTMSN
jgi:ATP-dependent DNA helicase PIF1